MITGKVLEITPGTVYKRETVGFSFTINVKHPDGLKTYRIKEVCVNSNAAKQKMRETVAFLKKKHGV